MKKYLIFIVLFASLLQTGCSLFKKSDNNEINRLQNSLDTQEGTRTAELEFDAHQAAIYRGCKMFVNICSKETNAIGEHLLQKGITGETSIWYLFYLLRDVTAIIGITLIFIYYLWALYVGFLMPSKREMMKEKQLLSNMQDQNLVQSKEYQDLNNKIKKHRIELNHYEQLSKERKELKTMPDVEDY